MLLIIMEVKSISSLIQILQNSWIWEYTVAFFKAAVRCLSLPPNSQVSACPETALS